MINSDAVKRTGNAKTLSQEWLVTTILLTAPITNENITGRKSVSIIANDKEEVS